jgi:hypothetical protein
MMMEATMKSIRLLVHDDEGQEARFQTALDLTRALAGHLTCIDVSMVTADTIGARAGKTPQRHMFSRPVTGHS